MNGLVFLEVRSLRNGIVRMFREPRRLVMVLAFVMMVAVMVVRATHPQEISPFPPMVRTILWTVLGSAAAIGLCVRIAVPTAPAYFSEPADAVLLLGAPVQPWELMLRRHWVQLLNFWRTALGLVYFILIVPGSFGEALRVVLFALLYVLMLDFVAIFGDRLRRHHVPVVAVGWAFSLVMAGIAVVPLLRTPLSPTDLFGRTFWFLTNSWGHVAVEAGIVVALMAMNVMLSPRLAVLNWERLMLAALRRQAVRGERTMADVVRARTALRVAHRTFRPWTGLAFHLSGPWVLFEAKLRMWRRGGAALRGAGVLALLALGAGYFVGHHAPGHAISALEFVSYIMILVVGTPPSMITNPMVVGAPRAVPLLMAEQGPSFIGWVTAYGLFWTTAAVFGVSFHTVILGYAWIVALTLVMTAWKLCIWSWFPDVGTRNLAGRLALILGGFAVGGIALLWLLWFPWGAIITVPWAVAEMWVLYRITLRRLTWAIGLARVNHGE